MSVKLTGWKVFRNGQLIFENVDIEIPDMGNLLKGFGTKERFQAADGSDIREGAIELEEKSSP
jgi:hypothetical protein